MNTSTVFQKRAKTPTILQMEAAECGAAALAIVLGYYGRYVSLEELRQECGVSRDGCRAINVLRAARRYGLIAQGAQAEPEALRDLIFPLIAFWELNHFVVIEGMDKKKVYLNDPATGPRTVTHKEFDGSFTGIFLSLEPGPDFQPGGEKNTLWKSLSPRLEGIKKSLVYIILCSLALTIPGVLIAGFSKVFIDEILIQKLSGWLLPLMWGIVLTALLRSALAWLQQFYLLKLQLNLSVTASKGFFWHILQLPMSFFAQRFSGDITSRLSANDRVSGLLSGDLSTSVVSLFNMVLFGVILLVYDWQLASIGMSMALVNVALLWFMARKIENKSRLWLQEEGKLVGIEMNGLVAMETLKATSAEDDFFRRFAGYYAKMLNSQQKIQLYALFLTLLPSLLSMISTISILGVGSLQIMQGALTIGGLVAFQSLLASFNDPLSTLLGLGEKLQEIRGDLSRLEDVLRHPVDWRFKVVSLKNEKPEKNKKNIQDAGVLELRNIQFGYSPLEPPLIDNLSLKLSPGARIAIVGVSGSGKSTIAKIACGLYQPWAGEVLLDGQLLSSFPRIELVKRLALVDQDISLFEGTVKDNLSLWDENISMAQLERATQEAQALPMLMARAGYESEVIQGGSNFSGGQRQQLEIARALVTDPEILILDEATAAMDTHTEQTVMKNLQQRDAGLLIITHRLDMIQTCDEIIVLKHGQVAERGTHQVLSQRSGIYCDLLASAGGLNHA